MPAKTGTSTGTSTEGALSSSSIYPLENYTAADFSLPLEELPDGRLSHGQSTLLRHQWARINKARNMLQEERRLRDHLEELAQKSIDEDARNTLAKTLKEGKSLNTGLYSVGPLRRRHERITQAAKEELQLINKAVGNNYSKIQHLANIQHPNEFGDESTIDFPKLGSLEEMCEDLRQEQIEKYCTAHGRKAAARFVNSDKRMLRKWFRELDVDHSGEVSVSELQDPLLSAGIFLTSEQVFRVMLNADKNSTAGLDFEEFLNALYSSHNTAGGVANEATAIADNEDPHPSDASSTAQGHEIDVSKLKKLQVMGADPHGFTMETLISAERRGKLFNSVVNQLDKRESEFKTVHGKYIDSSRKLEQFKIADKELGTRPIGHIDFTNSPISERRAAAMRARERARVTANATVAKRDLSYLLVKHENEKKLHQQYVDALDRCMQLKRTSVDKRTQKATARLTKAILEGETSRSRPKKENDDDAEDQKDALQSNMIHADRVLNHDKSVYTAYRRKTPSMFGKDTRRIFLEPVVQVDIKAS